MQQGRRVTMLLVRRMSLAPALVLASALAGGVPVAAQDPAGASGGWLEPLAVGVCFELTVVDRQVDVSVPPAIVDCAQPHGHEVVALVPLPEGDLPADVAEQTEAGCATAFEAFLGRPVEEVPAVFPFPVWPDEADWAAGIRASVCILGGSGLIGTAASGHLRAPGETIAAYWQPQASSDLWLFDGGTGEARRALTDDATTELLGPPAWLPDGSALLIGVQRSDEDVDVFRVPADASGAKPLVVGDGKQDAAAVSPDGTRVAYISNEAGGEHDIWVAGIDGTGGAAITDHPGRDATPRWSPDGRRILFRRSTDGLSEIWVMNADGSDPRRLIDNGTDSYDPRWSPDGEHILFTTTVGGSMDIWTANADGTDAHQLTDHPGAEEYPTFSSDGRFIAFQSDRLGSPTLWLMNADGTDGSVLVGAGPVGYASFSPVASEG